MWRPWKRHRLDVEAIVSALSDAAARVSASADKVIAALQAAGTGGEDTAPIVAALDATSDRLDAAVAVATGTGTSPPAPVAAPPAGGTPEQPAG